MIYTANMCPGLESLHPSYQLFMASACQKFDNGYDIIALMNIKMQNPLKFLVECKRYSKKKVGIEIIRGFIEVISSEKANRGIIVTTSYFTKGALKKPQQMPHLLELPNKDKVIEWVNDYFKSPQL
ncbi:restriction endonuclease [Niastella populi]|uniref:Restriction endonuclease type IV Mrr domain-containing protein n=1 Tax=Niastella populi TaxID=550983 RepID=A0A1V9G2E6_9BACT|nr:restriction endonuclease [Niastella populi]OQP64636.1 hypothetical protein A4R26_16460 [Niastella populi]